MATTSASSSKTHIVIPAMITHKEDGKPAPQQANAYCVSLGIILRNIFYLPWYKRNPPSEMFIEADLAKKVSDTLMRSGPAKSEEMGLIKSHFSIRDVAVHLQGQKTTRIFNVRLFESKKPVCNKTLRLILFSYNGNQERQELNDSRRWEPLTVKELSESPLLVLKAFQKSGVNVDSLMATSLGSVMMDSFKDIPQNPDDQKNIPSTLVLNRGLASVKKIAMQYWSPFSYMLYGAAKLTGWDADPEQGLLDFLGKTTEERKVVIIEAQEDFYFSKAGGLSSDYHTKIESLGAKVFRAAFFPFPFHTRAHHALSLEHLVNNKATKVIRNSAQFALSEEESAASLIANNVFFSGDADFHTCFYVCGNDAGLDVGTAREAFPLLSAFVKEGKMMETKLTEEMAS